MEGAGPFPLAENATIAGSPRSLYMVIAILIAGLTVGFFAAGAAFIVGSPLWLAIAAGIAFCNIGTTLASAWLLLRKMPAPTYTLCNRRPTVNREEAEEDLRVVGLPSPLNGALPADAETWQPSSLDRAAPDRVAVLRPPGGRWARSIDAKSDAAQTGTSRASKTA